MNVALVVILVIGLVLLAIMPGIVGAVLARRAFKRWQWPEARLLYLAFLAGLVVTIAPMITMPLIGWLSPGNLAFDLIRWASAFFSLAGSIPVIAIAIGLFRISRRASRVDVPPVEFAPATGSG